MILMALVIVGILRRIGPILEHAESRIAAAVQNGAFLGGIPVSSRAPEFRVLEKNGDREYGRELTSAELIRTPTILLFMEANCEPCKQLAQGLEPDVDEIEGIPFRVILHEDEGRPEWIPRGVPVLYERHQELSQAFENIATPQAYLLDAGRIVLQKHVARSISDLQEMARRATTTTERR